MSPRRLQMQCVVDRHLSSSSSLASSCGHDYRVVVVVFDDDYENSAVVICAKAGTKPPYHHHRHHGCSRPYNNRNDYNDNDNDSNDSNDEDDIYRNNNVSGRIDMITTIVGQAIKCQRRQGILPVQTRRQQQQSRTRSRAWKRPYYHGETVVIHKSNNKSKNKSSNVIIINRNRGMSAASSWRWLLRLQRMLPLFIAIWSLSSSSSSWGGGGSWVVTAAHPNAPLSTPSTPSLSSEYIITQDDQENRLVIGSHHDSHRTDDHHDSLPLSHQSGDDRWMVDVASTPSPPLPSWSLQIVETQVWNESTGVWMPPTWMDARSGHSLWSSSSSSSSLSSSLWAEPMTWAEPPPELLPTTVVAGGFDANNNDDGWWKRAATTTLSAQWEGDWKIVTTTSMSTAMATSTSSLTEDNDNDNDDDNDNGVAVPRHLLHRDPYGWSYHQAAISSSDTTAMLIRRRLWLRKVVILDRRRHQTTTNRKGVFRQHDDNDDNELWDEEALEQGAHDGTNAKMIGVSPEATTISSTQTTAAPSRAGTLSLAGATSRRRHPSKPIKSSSSSSVNAWMRHMRDDWNFKGFGISMYKSLVFPTSCGIACRIPLTLNFGWWERHPALPSITSSIALYYPWCIVVFFNASMRLEWIRWMMNLIVNTATHLVGWLLWTSWMLVWTVLHVVISPWVGSTRTIIPSLSAMWQQPPRSVRFWELWTSNAGPAYSRTVEERWGGSVSWRVSASRGYEFRTSLWHYYVPSLVRLWQWCFQQPVHQLAAVTRFLTGGSSTDTKSTVSWLQQPPAWFARRSAALGVSISGPIPEEPWITTSAVLALSGYYFSSKRSSRTASSTTSSSSSTTLRIAATSTSTTPVAVPIAVEADQTASIDINVGAAMDDNAMIGPAKGDKDDIREEQLDDRFQTVAGTATPPTTASTSTGAIPNESMTTPTLATATTGETNESTAIDTEPLPPYSIPHATVVSKLSS